MPQGSGGRVGHYWNTTKEPWFEANPQIFLPFPYATMEFQGDQDMGLPAGYAFGQPRMSFCFLHLLYYLCLYVYYNDTDIVLVTLADVGKFGRPVAQLVEHQLIQQPQGACGGQVGAPAQPLGGEPGGVAGPSRAHNSLTIVETTVKQARANATEALVLELTEQVTSLEDTWGQVDCMTQGIPT